MDDPERAAHSRGPFVFCSRFLTAAASNTTLGVVTFLVHHEAYHLGQLGLLRKGLGYGPTSYRRR